MFALISAPDEYAMAVIALIFIVFSILIWLPAIIISLIKFYKFAAKKKTLLSASFQKLQKEPYISYLFLLILNQYHELLFIAY